MSDHDKALRRDGSVLIRGALAPAAIASALASVERYWKARSDRGEPRSRYGGASFVLARDNGHPGLSDIFAAVQTSPILPAVRGFLGDDVYLVHHHCLTRYYYRDAARYDRISPFHQDICAVDPRIEVTSWIPLSSCGVTSPGLEWVDARVDEIYPVVPHPKTSMEIEPNEILARHADRLRHPPFSAGDALLFLNKTPHRTYVTPGMTEGRYSVELRYVPGRALSAAEKSDGNFILLG